MRFSGYRSKVKVTAFKHDHLSWFQKKLTNLVN